jgi:hypothetical protein
MADRDPISVCTALKEAGASPQAVYEAAKANGLDRIEAIRLLRELFGFSLKAAKDVVALVDGPPKPRFVPIETRGQLLEVLGAELGYCGCASDDALELLVRFLRVVQKRSDSTSGSSERGSATSPTEVGPFAEASASFRATHSRVSRR